MGSWEAVLYLDGADRRLAGLSVAGRAAAEACAAGAVAVRIARPHTLAAETRDDLLRVCGATPLRTAAEPAAVGLDTIEIICRHHLARSPDLAALARADGARLVWEGELLASREGAGGEVAAGPPLDLGRPLRATRVILLGTVKPSDGPISRWLNRPVSRALSALLLQIPGARPIHASIATALAAVLMFLALLAGGPEGLAAGALLHHAASILDGVDGELARATFRSSRAGAIIDSAIDVSTSLLFIVGFALNLGARGGFEVAALAIWGFALFVIGLALIVCRSARTPGPFSLDFVKHHYAERFAGRAMSGPIRFLTIVSSRDFYAFLFLILVAVGFPIGVLYLFAAAATVWLPFVLASTLAPSGPLAAPPVEARVGQLTDI